MAGGIKIYTDLEKEEQVAPVYTAILVNYGSIQQNQPNPVRCNASLQQNEQN